MATAKFKHGITIAAKDVDTFNKADKILSCFVESFIKHFTTCETTLLGHGILSLTSTNFWNQSGIILPENTNIEKITLEENLIEVTARLNKGSDPSKGKSGIDLVLVLKYHFNHPIKKMETFHIGSIEEIIEAYHPSTK